MLIKKYSNMLADSAFPPGWIPRGAPVSGNSMTSPLIDWRPHLRRGGLWLVAAVASPPAVVNTVTLSAWALSGVCSALKIQGYNRIWYLANGDARKVGLMLAKWFSLQQMWRRINSITKTMTKKVRTGGFLWPWEGDQCLFLSTFTGIKEGREH